MVRTWPRTSALLTAIVLCHSEGVATEAYFAIPKQQADIALMTFARQANVAVLFPFDEVSKVTANPLMGEYDIEEGAQVLLEGTGLTAVLETARQLVVRVETAETGESGMKGNRGRGFFASLFGGASGCRRCGRRGSAKRSAAT